MIEVRRAESDADLEAWILVKWAAEDGLTVVRRDWRRRGLAKALKQLELAWAAGNGLREVVNGTQRGNEGMRALNEQLGYEYRTVSLTMLADLPLKGLS